MRLSSINHYGIVAATCCFLCYFIEKQKRADNPRSLLVCGLSALRLCVRHSYYYLILTMIITGCRIHCNIGDNLTINFYIDLIYTIT